MTATDVLDVNGLHPRVATLAKLREAFDPRVVGKLPRVTCKTCSDRSANCQQHKKQKCADCGAFITTAHIHLDYVGHAETTDRLLSVDPLWTWEPFAVDDRGLPAFERDQRGNPTRLWIRLTVCGVTRIGVGSVDGAAFDAEKQLIGDAIRNAAMRFGVALDLWSKSELESTLTETHDAPAAVSPPADVDGETGEVKSRRRPPPRATEAKATERSQPRSVLPDERPTTEERQALRARLEALPPALQMDVQASAKGRVPNVLGADFSYDHLRLLDELLSAAEREISGADAGDDEPDRGGSPEPDDEPTP